MNLVELFNVALKDEQTPFAEQLRNIRRCQPSQEAHPVLNNRVPQLVENAQLLGAGGFGEVFRVTVRDPELFGGKPFTSAMKVIKFQPQLDLASQKQLFQQEVLSMAASFVDIFAHVVDDEMGIIFMEDLPGDDLLNLVREGQRANFREALSLFSYLLILSWLNFSRLGLFHGDIKPDNVIKLQGTMVPTFRLIDWGLTCIMSRDLRSEFSSNIIPLCTEQKTRGSPGYLSPWYWKTGMFLEGRPEFLSSYDPRALLLDDQECQGISQNRSTTEAALESAASGRSVEERKRVVVQKAQELNELWGICSTVYSYLTGMMAYEGDQQIADIQDPISESLSNYLPRSELIKDMMETLQRNSPQVSGEDQLQLATLIANGLRHSGLPCESISGMLNALFAWVQKPLPDGRPSPLRPIVQRQISQFKCRQKKSPSATLSSRE